jgi:hypothetical protein
VANTHFGKLLSVGLLIGLAACARPVGDFGRAQPGVLHDEIMPAIGNARAQGSTFNLADQEVEMRDRIWRYLVAPHAYDWFGDIAVEYQRTRILPMSNKPLKTRLYYDWLHTERFASSRVRYSRVEEDAIADIAMVPPTFAAICAVIELDRQRGVAWNAIGGLEKDVGINAAKRHAENRDAINWFVRSLRYRYESYSYALNHLLVETPHEEAIDLNARLNVMVVHVESAERGDFCGGSDTGGRHGGKGIPSRFLLSQPDEGLYRK